MRVFLALLFVLLVAPSVVLIVKARDQLKWEAFHRYRTIADGLGMNVDAQLRDALAAEEARSPAEYGFAAQASSPAAATSPQRSALAGYPVQSMLPGVVGYFQIDADGGFSTPSLPGDGNGPARQDMSAAERQQRTQLRDRLLSVLDRNQLLEHSPTRLARGGASAVKPGATPSPPEGLPMALARPPVSQAAFDELNTPTQRATLDPRRQLGRVDDLRLGQSFQQQALKEAPASTATQQLATLNSQSRGKRTEPSTAIEPAKPGDQRSGIRTGRIFQSEIDPFEFSLLADGHGVLYRKVWRDGRRTIQGAVIDQRAFIEGAIVKPFEATALAQMSDLAIAYRQDVVRLVAGTDEQRELNRAEELRGELLHQLRLSAPLGDFQLFWTIRHLPAGPVGRLVLWASLALSCVLVAGFFLLYRLGMKQILLARQQQDFIAAVSHELKTPLTSIRMYAEMLGAGWVEEPRKREYYRFIQDESERLSRLIANVLRLAHMERNELHLQLKAATVVSMIDLLRSKLSQQIEHAGFECRYDFVGFIASHEIAIDADAFAQIMINLVDNALKFSSRSAVRRIEITASAHGVHHVAFSVRDHGPGIEKSQTKRIFELFYRPGSELTRETAGTGIGLALVRQLAHEMAGHVEVHSREPGAEFRVIFPSRANAPALDA